MTPSPNGLKKATLGTGKGRYRAASYSFSDPWAGSECRKRRKHEMRRRTRGVLKILEAGAWFSRVGQPVGAGVKSLATWKAASNALGSNAQEWVELVAAAGSEEYCQRLFERSPKRFYEWSEV